MVVVRGKQLKCGGGGGGGKKNNRNVVVEGKQFKCGDRWWWSRGRKTIEFYGLKTYKNAQHSTSLSLHFAPEELTIGSISAVSRKRCNDSSSCLKRNQYS